MYVVINNKGVGQFGFRCLDCTKILVYIFKSYFVDEQSALKLTSRNLLNTMHNYSETKIHAM